MVINPIKKLSQGEHMTVEDLAVDVMKFGIGGALVSK